MDFHVSATWTCDVTFIRAERHPAWPEHEHVQIQSPIVAETACHLELWSCRFICHRGGDRFAVAGVALRGSSRVFIFLYRHVDRVVWRDRTRIARNRPLHRGFLLLFLIPGAFVCRKAGRNATPCSFCRFGISRWFVERCAKKRNRFAEARPR